MTAFRQGLKDQSLGKGADVPMEGDQQSHPRPDGGDEPLIRILNTEPRYLGWTMMLRCGWRCFVRRIVESSRGWRLFIVEAAA